MVHLLIIRNYIIEIIYMVNNNNEKLIFVGNGKNNLYDGDDNQCLMTSNNDSNS